MQKIKGASMDGDATRKIRPLIKCTPSDFGGHPQATKVRRRSGSHGSLPTCA